MLLSICIPTYNRSEQLDNCLNSILISGSKYNNFEVCVSDNNSSDNTKQIVEKYKDKLNINYSKNSKNIGFARNAISVVSMAKGKYSWLLGDDDLILPQTINKLEEILKKNKEINFFFINSFYLNSKYLKSFSKPFNTNNLRSEDLEKLSSQKKNRVVNYWDLVNPNVSWEFMLGIFLTIFKTSEWLKASQKVDKKKIDVEGIWSTFENTCFHPIVNTYAFKNSKAYICSEPLSINIIGFREWTNYYEAVEIIRIPELIDFYRKEGLPLKKYLYSKNFALRNFSNYIFKILFLKNMKGKEYFDFKNHLLKNLYYPNVYFSLIRFVYRKIKFLFKKYR